MYTKTSNRTASSSFHKQIANFLILVTYMRISVEHRHRSRFVSVNFNSIAECFSHGSASRTQLLNHRVGSLRRVSIVAWSKYRKPYSLHRYLCRPYTNRTIEFQLVDKSAARRFRRQLIAWWKTVKDIQRTRASIPDAFTWPGLSLDYGLFVKFLFL